MALNNTSFESDIGGPIRKSTSIASLASSAYIGSWFVLDVAGKEFRALKTALTREPCSFLAKIVEDDIDTEQLAMDSNGLIVYMPDTSSGRWQLDTSPEYFEYILKYLRTGKFNGVKSEHSLEDLLDEAEMFRLTKFVDILRQKIFEKNTISTSTTPSETSIFASNLVKPTPPSSIYNNQFVPPSQLSRPPGLFPPSTGHQPPPTLYNQPPPGFENFNINQQQQSNQLLDTFEEERVFSETSSDQNFKIIDVSDKEDDNLESKFNSKNFRVPAFELTIDGIVRNYAKILPVRKRHTQEFLKYLSQSDKSLEFNYFSKFGVEMGCVLFYLQRLALLYPEGCTIKQYCDYELIQKNARPCENNQCFNNTVPSVVLLLQAGDLLKFDDKGKICVAEAVCKVKLICLRQNLCSNLFRFLLRRKQYRAPVQLLLEEMKLMVPSNVESQPDSRCLLSICNRFPAVFELICNKSDNFDFYRSSIALNEAIIKKDDNLYWRIVLDCEYSNINYFDNEDDINNNYGSCFCDCENCQSLGKNVE